MGVRGLYTYLQWCCPKARYLVHIPDVVSQESYRTGCRPKIVVDAPSCYSTWCKGIDWTIGLEVQELIQNLRSFVEAFEEMDADLVFFVGGLTPLKKRKTWLKRRIDGMQKMMDVHDLLNAGQTYEDLPEKLNSIPPNVGNFVAFVLKYVLNCEVYQTIRECDDEVINYIREHDCFAIFAYDTDFIVCQVNCKVLGANTYDCNTKNTFMYDRVELCKYLNIAVDQLPLLAILAGNDMVDFETLKPFHHRICCIPDNELIPYKILMESIADYINTLPRRINSKVMAKICLDVFGDIRNVTLMNRGYYAYTPHPAGDYYTSEDPWSLILRMAKVRFQQNVLLPPSAWGVINKQVYESSVCLEDFRKIHNSNSDVKLLPSATITRDLRRRFYGVLLFEKRDSKPVVREWCGENTGSYVKTVRVKPLYPKVHHPGLRALWNVSTKVDQIQNKWKLFLEAVSPGIENVVNWMLLPADLVVSTATCYYLYREKSFLSKIESKAILKTLAMVSDQLSTNLDKIRAQKDSLQCARARQICVTFSRTYSIVFSLMASCGFPVQLSKNTAHIKFEPMLFHFIHHKVIQLASSVNAFGESNATVQKNFQSMQDIIFN